MLDQAGDLLHVGEGIETMIAARQLGLAPAWALGSAGMVAHFPVISTGHLRICGERDEASARGGALHPALAGGRPPGAGRAAHRRQGPQRRAAIWRSSIPCRRMTTARAQYR